MRIFKNTDVLARELMQLNGVSTNAYRNWANQEGLYKVGKHWLIDRTQFKPPKRKKYNFSECTNLEGYALLRDYQNFMLVEKEFFSTLEKRIVKHGKDIPFNIKNVGGATLIKVPPRVLREYNNGNVVMRVTPIDAIDFDDVFFEHGVLYGVY